MSAVSLAQKRHVFAIPGSMSSFRALLSTSLCVFDGMVYFLRRCLFRTSACTRLQGLGVGGAGHFALWLDNDLFEGSSNSCLTFASPCLASKSDFHVSALELWQIT